MKYKKKSSNFECDGKKISIKEVEIELSTKRFLKILSSIADLFNRLFYGMSS